MNAFPTLEQRLDAAAEEWRRLSFMPRNKDVCWAKLSPKTRRLYRDEIQSVCRAFAPEHFKDVA